MAEYLLDRVLLEYLGQVNVGLPDLQLDYGLVRKLEVLHDFGDVDLPAAGNPLDPFEAIEHAEHAQVRQGLLLLVISRII